MSKAFDRVLIVMFENQYRSYVMKDPFMAKLRMAGADLTNSFGAFHPSQTNYIASLAGEVCAVTNDTPPAAALTQQSLVNLLEAQNVSWKAYMEGYPNEPWNPAWANPSYPITDQPTTEYPNNGTDLAYYFRKHNAFASFQDIQSSQERWAKIVDEGQFWKDVQAKDWPEYGWFTPDIWNDGHYAYNTHTSANPRTQLVPQMSTWLEYTFFGNLPADKVQGAAAWGVPNVGLKLDLDLLQTDPDQAWANSNVPEGTLIVITFDEADFDATGYDTNYDGPNQIYTVLLGNMITPGTTIDTPHNHYSLMNTIERNFNLGSLNKNDKDANHIRALWNEQYSWSAVTDTNTESGNTLAATTFKGVNYVLYTDTAGTLQLTGLKADGTWIAPVALPAQSTGLVAMASTEDTMMIMLSEVNGMCFNMMYEPGMGFSGVAGLPISTPESIAFTEYQDYADSAWKFMFCWSDSTGLISYQVYSGGSWQTKQSVGQYTDGPLQVAQMGPSLFLVYKESNTREMRMTSYNLAPFNAFDAQNFEDQPDVENNTSLHAWSPADFPVGNFAKKMNATQNQYQSRGAMAMATIAGEMHLVHRGGYTDTPQAYDTFFGLTGIFTASSQWTNGFGTIDQAGWTTENELSDVQLAVDGPMAMASDGTSLFLIWLDQMSNTLKYKTATYQ